MKLSILMYMILRLDCNLSLAGKDMVLHVSELVSHVTSISSLQYFYTYLTSSQHVELVLPSIPAA